MIRLPEFRYLAPGSLEEACRFMDEHGLHSRLMGGGTDLLPAMKLRVNLPEYVVNLSHISGLDFVRYTEDAGLTIGPSVRLRALETNPLVLERYPAISQAARTVGSPQIRQMGTVGGNLNLDTRCDYFNQPDFWRQCKARCFKMGGDTCNAVGGGRKCFAVFSGDLAPVLIAHDALITLRSTQGERTMALSQFYSGNGIKPLAIEPGDVLSAVRVPRLKEGAASFYNKFSVRKAIDFPLAGVATVLTFDEERRCSSVKVVIGAVGPKPVEVKEIGELLKEKQLTSQLIEKAGDLAFSAARPVANRGSSPAYRREMVRQLVKKSLKQAEKAPRA
jgi:4-hydroxybenzoyl-CoA reductase subunit beta